jgi:hypothetical protein
MFAAMNGHVEIVKLLYFVGANLDAKANVSQLVLFSKIIIRIYSFIIRIIALL